MVGIETLKRNPRISTIDLRRAVLLGPIHTHDTTVPRVFLERLEHEIATRIYVDSLNQHRSRRLSRDHPQRNNSRSRSRLHRRERTPVIEIHSDSETETDTETESESETPPAGCPRSVRDRMRRLLEPRIREQIRRELEQQLRQEIRHEIEPQLRTQIQHELEPRLNMRIQREMEPLLRAQIYQELEAQIWEQVRGEIIPTRHNIENEIREGDEHRAWVDFLLYILDEHEVNDTLDTAVAICDVCLAPCMNRRPITLNCGHVFCGNCIREWCYESKQCPKCRTPIRFSQSVFRAYPTLDTI